MGLHHSFFIDQAAARQMQQQLDLQNLRKDDLSMSDYLQKIKGLRDSLHAVGYTMSDHDKVMKVFDGLPLEYDSLVNPLLAQLPPPSFERTRAFLLAYEARLASRPRNTQGGQPQGSFSQTPQQPNQRRGQQLRYTNNASRFSSGILGIAPVQCQWCDEFGHTVCTCPSHSSSLAAGSRNQSLAVLQLDDSTWYPDTGASAHMTSNPGNLLSSSPYHGNEKICVGNGSLLPLQPPGSNSSSRGGTPCEYQSLVLQTPEL